MNLFQPPIYGFYTGGMVNLDNLEESTIVTNFTNKSVNIHADRVLSVGGSNFGVSGHRKNVVSVVVRPAIPLHCTTTRLRSTARRVGILWKCDHL